MDNLKKNVSLSEQQNNSNITPEKSETIIGQGIQTYLSPVIVSVEGDSSFSYKSLRSTPSSSGSVWCRICHEDDKGDQLISPCDCIGSLRMIHVSCLEKWLSASNTDNCEICKYVFQITREPKPLLEWLKTSDKTGPKGMIADLLCLLLLTPLCFASVYLCGFGASVYMNHGVWEGTGLAVLGCFLMTTFILWCLVTARYHWKMFRDWQTKNQIVRLKENHKEQRTATCRNELNINHQCAQSDANNEGMEMTRLNIL